MKTKTTLFSKGMTKTVILLLACFITLPTLNAVNVLPNVKVNQNTYHKVTLDTQSKAIAVLDETVYAVWQGQPTESTSNIYFSKSIDGGLSFSTELNIYQGASSLSHLWASLYVTLDAKIHIAWAVSAVDGEFNVWYTNSEDGGQSFKTPIIITTNNASILACIGGYGNNVYIFYGSMENYPKADYYFVRSTNNGTSFESPIQINDTPCLSDLEIDGVTTMTIGANGTIYLAWSDGRRAEGNGDIFFAKSVDQGLSFSANVMVNDINGIGANAIQNVPSIAVEGDNVYVAFSDKRLGSGWQNKRAYLSISTNGGNTFYPESPLAGFTDSYTSFDIAVSVSGKLNVALCGHITPNWSAWLYESIDRGMSFSTPIALDHALECKFHKDIQLLSIPGDYVCAFWRNNCDGVNDIYFTKTSAQTTYIPDDNFLQALIDLGYGEGVIDKCIPTINLSGITNLNVSSKNISDLTGIEDFDALVSLNCSNNKLSSFDISEKTALKKLFCQNNKLTDLHLYNNTNLITLNCSSNQLPSLNISNNTALNELYCGDNPLLTLDISTNIALTNLGCFKNQLSILDVSNNTALINLNYSWNKLPNLDISKNIALNGLSCSGNSITFLDVSKHTALINLWCNNNSLTNLDIRNGNNANITNFDAHENPALTCIYVNDKTASYLSAWIIDATSHFVNNEAECVAVSVNDIKEHAISVYPNPTNGILNFNFLGANVQKIKIADISGRIILEKTNLKQTEEIDLSVYANGMYMVILLTDKESKLFKIVKE